MNHQTKILPIMQNISPEQAAKLLEEHGMLITVKEAEMVLNFLYTLAALTAQHD